MTKDMTEGKPLRLIIGFAVPMFLGMLFQQFYSMVDTIIVGKFLGVNPLAGVGSTSSLNFLVIGFVSGVCNGCAVPVDIFQYAYVYIVIIFWGIPCTFLYNMLAGIIRSLGDSRTPVVFLAISSLINIVLDIAFIVVFHMGVEGPALATVISQGGSGLICLWHVKKRFAVLKMSREEWGPDGLTGSKTG